MARLTPVSLRIFIGKLNKSGYKGPFSGGKHLFMIKDNVRLTLPNPHRKEIGVDLLKRILKQADISINDWLKL